MGGRRLDIPILEEQRDLCSCRQVDLEVHEKPLHPATVGGPRREALRLQWYRSSRGVDESNRRIARQFAICEGDPLRDGPRQPVDVCRFIDDEWDSLQLFLSDMMPARLTCGRHDASSLCDE